MHWRALRAKLIFSNEIINNSFNVWAHTSHALHSFLFTVLYWIFQFSFGSGYECSAEKELPASSSFCFGVAVSNRLRQQHSPILMTVLNISGGMLVACPSIDSGGEIRSKSCSPPKSEQHEQCWLCCCWWWWWWWWWLCCGEWCWCMCGRCELNWWTPFGGDVASIKPKFTKFA